MKLHFMVVLISLAFVTFVGLGWMIRIWVSPYVLLSEYQLDPNREQDIKDFKRNYLLWKSQNIQDYRLTQEGDCWTCQSPQEIEVASGKSLGAYLVLENGKKEKHDQSHLGTVDELFEEIRQAIETKAGGITVEYDPTLGYPVKASIDYRNDTADDGCSHHILELKVLR